MIEKVHTRLDNMMIAELARPYTGEEIRVALFQMHPSKAPGPDGMSAVFYQKIWDVGADIIEHALHILNHGGEVFDINHTHVVLIPKKKVCETPRDYRPISLCNVLYKIISKTLANRMKEVLPSIIN